LIVRIAVFDRGVLALDEACFRKAPAERGNEMRESIRVSTAQKPNHRHCRLLRTCRDRPGRRAAEERDEVAAVHVWMAPAWQEIIRRAA
jgi:hypothetical protein